MSNPTLTPDEWCMIKQMLTRKKKGSNPEKNRAINDKRLALKNKIDTQLNDDGHDSVVIEELNQYTKSINDVVGSSIAYTLS